MYEQAHLVHEKGANMLEGRYMKRIFFTQQKPFDYLPLRAGLGYITEEELSNYPGFTGLCPKIYTTRTRPMKGAYYVVEGSRFKAKPVEPRIEFQVRISEELDLRKGIFKKNNSIVGWTIANRNDLTFPELDLGVHGATFEQLRDELLRLNPKTTIDTPFYVNLLERIDAPFYVNQPERIE